MAGGDPGGGSLGLAELIDSHGEHIVSDLRRYYNGVDLADVLVPGSGLTPKLVIAYIRNLPIESNTQQAINDLPVGGGWSMTDYMLANVIDVLNYNTYVTVAANSKRKPKPPKPIDRPTNKTKANPVAGKFAAMARIAHSAGKNGKKATNGGTGSD